NEIDAERAVGALLRLCDLGVEQVRRHRPAGDHPERAGVAERGDEVALRNPAHRPAEHRIIAAEEIGAALHVALQPVVADAGIRVAHAASSASSPKAVWSTRTASSV